LWCINILKSDMQSTAQTREYALNHISIDSVILGFDGKDLRVLLIPQRVKVGEKVLTFWKLPGDLIYVDEDFEVAAHRTLSELTGIHGVSMYQFKTYGSKDRCTKKDLLWLQQTTGIDVTSIVTTAYVSVAKLDGSMVKIATKHACEWRAVSEVGDLAFDHNAILDDAMSFFRKMVNYSPMMLFELLPRKFTILQLRTLFELIYQKKLDIRNFQKKLVLMQYVVPLDEFEEGVRHRAARFYRFDKVIYNKSRR
jgi:hypothetical protein